MVDTPTPVGALQLDVLHDPAMGIFTEDAATMEPECTNLVAGALPVANYDAVAGRLRLGWIALTPFTGPIDLATCRFSPSSAPPMTTDFTIVLNDATDLALADIVPSPTTTVSEVSCGGP